MEINNHHAHMGTIHQGYMLMNSDFAKTKFYETTNNSFGKDVVNRKQSIVYLLGDNKEMMNTIERELIRRGYIVRNPLRLVSANHKSHEWLRESIKLLVECNSLYLCPHNSKNSFIELQYRVANTLGLKLIESDVLIENIEKKL